MSNLLIDEYPLIILPTLARVIGLNEAVFLQQVHYWCEIFRKQKSQRHYHRGRWWVYNTDDRWVKDNFPFWSAATVKRTRTSCVRLGVLLVGRFNAQPYDRTNWYTVDRDAIDRLYNEWASGQDDQMEGINQIGSNRSSGTDADDQLEPLDQDEMAPPIPETTRDNQGKTQRQWADCLAELFLQLPRETFDGCLTGSELVEHSDGRAVVRVRVRAPFTVEWVRVKLSTPIRRTLTGVLDNWAGDVEFTTENEEAE